jgi:IclR family mhp operon transcriptional activator
MPIMRGNDVLATIGMTYYNSTYPLSQAVSTFVPLLRTLSQRISESASALEADDPAVESGSKFRSAERR